MSGKQEMGYGPMVPLVRQELGASLQPILVSLVSIGSSRKIEKLPIVDAADELGHRC